MSNLALLGGQPVFDQPLKWETFWPPVEDSTLRAIEQLYRSRRWSAFHEAEPAFAQAFAAHHGAAHGIFAINGTVTLQCALSAYGIGPGDEVIVPAVTWYATAMAVHHAGASPVLIDIEADTLCIDPEKIAAAITPRTRAIIPVHLFGSMADMDRIMAIAGRHDLRVIEDCAHMHGGVWNGTRVGSIGDVGSFSFQHSKTMSSGEGGICITNDPQIAERLYRIAHIGYAPGQAQGKATSGPPKGLPCYNFRATAFQAVILHEQLKGLESRLERYRQGAKYLQERLAGRTKVRLQAPGRRADAQGFWGWVMLFDDPGYADIPLDLIQKALEAEGLPSMRIWDPVYRFILFNLSPGEYRVDQECTVAERLVPRSLWLMHAYLGLEMRVLEKVGDALEKVLVNVHELKNSAKSRASA